MSTLEVVPESLARLGNLDPAVTWYPRIVRPRPHLELHDALLKWYDISRSPSRDDLSLEDLAAEARAHLEQASRSGELVLENALGFLELHHCDTVAFLIVFTWKNDNELWQTGFAKALDGSDSRFERITMNVAGHRPMLCVWELAPVWHERDAWNRYLASPRDQAAKLAWFNDRFAGPC